MSLHDRKVRGNRLAAAKVTGIDPTWPFAPHRKVHASRLGASPPKSKPGTTYRLCGRSALTASAFWARVSRRGPCATLRSKSAALTARTGGSNTTRAARTSPSPHGSRGALNPRLRAAVSSAPSCSSTHGSRQRQHQPRTYRRPGRSFRTSVNLNSGRCGTCPWC